MMTCLELAGIGAQLAFWPSVALLLYWEMRRDGQTLATTFKRFLGAGKSNLKRAVLVIGPALVVLVAITEFAPPSMCMA